ncbi:MAG: hypothetical protein RIS21_523, partial [Planctomycetota bacterium]
MGPFSDESAAVENENAIESAHRFQT